MKRPFLIFILLSVICSEGIAQDAWSFITEINGQSLGFIDDLLVTENGDIWVIATWNNPESGRETYVFHYQNNSWDIESERFSEIGLDMIEDSSGNIWFFSSSTISRFDGTELLTWETPFFLHDLDVAADGTMWCASHDGVYSFDGITWKNYTVKDGLPSNHANLIAVSPENEPWVRFGDTYQIDGVRGECGVSRLVGTSWVTYNTSNGLQTDLIDDIAFGPDELTYVSFHGGSSDPGISRYNGTSWELLPPRGGKILFSSNGSLG